MHDTLRPATALAPASLAIALLCALPARAADTQKLATVVAEQAKSDEAAVVAQQRIDQISDETQEMVAKYRQALTDTQSLRRYSEQLQVQVDAQKDELASVEKQLSDIENTSRDVLPMMQRMVDTLDKFVAADVPFLPEERAKRVSVLKDIMSRSDVPISEKYRRILEAYQIEMEYGRTLDAYNGKIGEGSGERSVAFVRVGRVALLYQTLDGNETGYWDQDQKKWVQDDSYRSAVKSALAVARKEGAPDLLSIPIPAPKEAKS
jgi:hypothetical protein